MGTRTYRSVEKWRASEIDNGGCLTRVETVHSDGKVEWSVKGTADGEYVNQSGVRKAECSTPIDFAVCDAARARMGWTIEAVS